MFETTNPDLNIKSYRFEYKVSFIDDYLAGLDSIYEAGDYIIIDQGLFQNYPDLVEVVTTRRHILIDANEQTKSFAYLDQILTRLIDDQFTRSNRLIAIGGGVTQDLTSFVASILYRGTNWFFMPTTLLTQCDSCIGSKTSINFGKYKNQLGSFFPPQHVYIDTNFLHSLPASEKRSGLGEMLHYFLVTSEDDLEMVEEFGEQALIDDSVLKRFIARSLEIKKQMIEIDEFDQGPRAIFNYGHSFGHAIEFATDNEVPHGVAVAYGMDLANLLSVELELIPMSLRNRIRESLSIAFGGTPLPVIDSQLIFDALRKDKKNIGSEIKVILTSGIGEMFKTTLEQNAKTKACIEDFFSRKLYETAL